MTEAVRKRRGLSFHERARRAAMSGRVIPYLAGSIAILAIVIGFVSTLVDRKDFPTFGTGTWWAIVTLGTIGYGDVVPHTAWGRVLGSIVIVFGVTFVSVLFATVTSYLISTDHERDRETHELLRNIASRLDTIEAELTTIKDASRRDVT